MTDEPLWVLILKLGLGIFVIIGIFSTVAFIDHWNQQNLLYNKNTISENVTVVSIDSSHGYVTSFIASNDKGYVMNSVFTFSRIDNIAVGHTYSIKYFCNPLDYNRRSVMEAIDLKPMPYECVTVNGVCS